MRRVSILLSFVILISAVSFTGCSKKEEASKAKPAVAAPTQANPAVNADMAKVYALYDDFKTKFVRTRDYQPSIDTAADASYACGRLAGGIADPEAKAFLAKLTDLLQQYRDEAKTYLSKDEQLKKDYSLMMDTINNSRGRLAKWEIDKLKSNHEEQREYVRKQADKVQDIRKQLLTLKS